MDWVRLERKWEQLKIQVAGKSRKSGNPDISRFDGNKVKLLSKLRELYGCTADQADQELGEFMKDCSCPIAGKSKTNDWPIV
jgi:hypothetical protein